MKKNRSAFAIIEVLVAFIILTTAMSLLTYAQKNFNTNINRLNKYENLYITVLSLKNKIDVELKLGDKMHYAGKLNGYNYAINLKKIQQGRNIISDDMSKFTNTGPHIYTLYKVTINLKNIAKKYSFYKVKTSIDEKQFFNNF